MNFIPPNFQSPHNHMQDFERMHEETMELMQHLTQQVEQLVKIQTQQAELLQALLANGH